MPFLEIAHDDDYTARRKALPGGLETSGSESRQTREPENLENGGLFDGEVRGNPEGAPGKTETPLISTR